MSFVGYVYYHCDIAKNGGENHRQKRLLRRFLLFCLILVRVNLSQAVFQTVAAVCSPVQDEIQAYQNDLNETYYP